MTHVSQIHRSLSYSVLNSEKELVGKTILAVVKLSERATAYITNFTILVLDKGSVVSKENLLTREIAELEKLTGIKEYQLF